MSAVPGVSGLVCPMVTPFDKSGRVDTEAARQLVDFLLSKGVAALFPCGTTGEGLLLNSEERRTLAEVVVDHTKGRAPVMVHTGCISTAETIALTRHAASIGAAAATIIAPFFHTLDDESLFNHFLAAARAEPDFPIFLYAFPGNAKNDVSPGLLRRLRDAAPNVVGIKSSNPSLIRFQEYVEAGGDGLIPLCGVDGLMLPSLTVGGMGQVSGNSNAFPEVFVSLLRAYEAGDMEGARESQRMINTIRAIMRDGLNPAYYKAVLSLRGVPAGEVRPPIRELSRAELDEMESALQRVGLI
jgi:4-hydroxy-tetrahydrodipicolinate synthase